MVPGSEGLIESADDLLMNKADGAPSEEILLGTLAFRLTEHSAVGGLLTCLLIYRRRGMSVVPESEGATLLALWFAEDLYHVFE